MSLANYMAALGRRAMSFTIRSNRGGNKDSFGVEEDKDLTGFVHAEDYTDKVDLASIGKMGLSYFHRALYNRRTTPFVVSYTRNKARLVEEKRSKEDKPAWLRVLQRLCVMRPSRIGPNIFLSLEIPTCGGGGGADIKGSGGVCNLSIERLLEDKIGKRTAEVLPTIGGGALSPTTVKDSEENNFHVNSELQFALVDQSISSSSMKSRHSSTPVRARHDFVEQRGQRLLPSSQRSHSVSPQRTRLAASKRSSFDDQQERGQNLPQRYQASPLQKGCNSSQSGKKELPEGTFPCELIDAHYINILQSLGQTVHIFKTTGEITYWNRFVEFVYRYSTSESFVLNSIELLVHQNSFEVENSIIDGITVEESWKGQFPLETKFGNSFSAIRHFMMR
ncbi:hypothetical protein SUGI_0863500 [Cryptomeria japonica]|nr:hypothetical protein SUGI_0863500 [Cryptomeria japonica]